MVHFFAQRRQSNARRAQVRAAFCLPLLFALCSSALGADWSVHVVDQSGKPVAGAAVLLRNGTKAQPGTAATEIAQRNAEFAPDTSIVTQGTPVHFPNFDRARHHVYSFSEAKAFEIELYKGTPSAPVIFGEPGIVTIGCNIHDWMYGVVYVVDTPYHALSDEQGRATVYGIDPGEFALGVWHPLAAQSGQTATVRIGASNATPHRATVELRDAPPRPQRPAPIAPRKR